MFLFLGQIVDRTRTWTRALRDRGLPYPTFIFLANGETGYTQEVRDIVDD